MKKETTEKLIELRKYVDVLEFAQREEVCKRIDQIFVCEMNDQKIGKFDLYSLASDDESYKPLMGVYHKDGYKYVTNAHILCKTKQDYMPEFEGRVIMPDGSLLPEEETRVPRYDSVIPANLNDYICIYVDFSKVAEWQKVAKLHKKIYRKNARLYVSVHEDTTFVFEDFVKFAKAMQAFGLSQIMVHEKDRTKFGVVKNDETTIIICSVVKSVNDVECEEIKWFKL